MRKSGSGKRRGGESDGVWDGDVGRGGSRGERRRRSRSEDSDEDASGVVCGSSGKVGEGETSGDEEVGHVDIGQTDPSRCRPEVGGTRGVEMSPEDGRI